MEAATEVPPQQCFLLDDEGEFPPPASLAAKSKR